MEENSVTNELSLSQSAKAHLKTVGKWVCIISIIGILGAMFIIGSSIYTFIAISRLNSVPTGGGVGIILVWFMAVICFIMGVFCFFPFYYLYKFSSNVKIAFRDDDSEALENSFRYLKWHYISLAILLLIYAVLYFSLILYFK